MRMVNHRVEVKSDANPFGTRIALMLIILIICCVIWYIGPAVMYHLLMFFVFFYSSSVTLTAIVYSNYKSFIGALEE